MTKPYSYRRRQRRNPPQKATWLTTLTRWLLEWWNRRQANRLMEDATDLTASPGMGLGLGALLSALDWDHVREEVDRESRAHITLAGATHTGKSTLLDCLRGVEKSGFLQPPERSEAGSENAGFSEIPPADEPIVENLGLFDVVEIPAQSPNGHSLESDPVWLAFQGADLILWMLDSEAGLRPWEYEWICHVRALGKALTVILNKIDQARDASQVEQLGHTLGCQVIPISARDGTNVATRLLPHIADVSPNLMTALGRESPAWRRIAAQKVTQRAAALSGLVGIEPVPLLDIPFQVLIQLRLVLRLAAIYGEPLNDRYSRELLATIVSGAALRYAGQELSKLIPLVGWVASAGLAAGGTWLIGRAAAGYFENGRRVPLPALRAGQSNFRLPRFIEMIWGNGTRPPDSERKEQAHGQDNR